MLSIYCAQLTALCFNLTGEPELPLLLSCIALTHSRLRLHLDQVFQLTKTPPYPLRVHFRDFTSSLWATPPLLLSYTPPHPTPLRFSMETAPYLYARRTPLLLLLSYTPLHPNQVLVQLGNSTSPLSTKDSLTAVTVLHSTSPYLGSVWKLHFTS